jgi:hypothetical protein
VLVVVAKERFLLITESMVLQTLVVAQVAALTLGLLVLAVLE